MRLIEKVWFENNQAKWWLVPLLLPLTLIFWVVSCFRRSAFKFGLLKSYAINKPVIVVGNIGVGGNGKTPVVIHLVEQAKKLGFKPGVISRGYGGKAELYPYLLNDQSSPKEAGDEPVLIAKRCCVPVVVGADRVANAQMLTAQGCDLIISDDGLQHYRLQRDIEIIVVDGKRQFGNGLLLPAGPLREGVWRLKCADIIIYNGVNHSDFSALLMSLVASKVKNVQSGKAVSIDEFIADNNQINAIAGIGAPQRFFDTLHASGFNIAKQQGFVDHKNFTEDDFKLFKSELPLLMTEKDAVKCQLFAQPNWWYLPVDAQFSEQDQQALQQVFPQII